MVLKKKNILILVFFNSVFFKHVFLNRTRFFFQENNSLRTCFSSFSIGIFSALRTCSVFVPAIEKCVSKGSWWQCPILLYIRDSKNRVVRNFSCHLGSAKIQSVLSLHLFNCNSHAVANKVLKPDSRIFHLQSVEEPLQNLIIKFLFYYDHILKLQLYGDKKLNDKTNLYIRDSHKVIQKIFYVIAFITCILAIYQRKKSNIITNCLQYIRKKLLKTS